MVRLTANGSAQSTAPLSFKAKLWLAAAKLSLHHLAPRGMASFVPANGSMSSRQSGENEIRPQLIEAELMVAHPGQLVYSLY